MIYLASSWRNPHYDGLRDQLRALYGHDAIYDFKVGSFRWRDLLSDLPARDDPSPGVQGAERHIQVNCADMMRFIADPRAQDHFALDFQALKDSDTLVLLLPCGRSAHSEYGWAAARGLHTIVYQPAGVLIEPELMYSWADWFADDLEGLMRSLFGCGYTP